MREVAGSHNAVYEAYYREVDPNNQGSVGAFEAARFLKRSGLTDAVLSKVWDLSDPAGKGYLNKDGFFVALKLVSLAQSGKEVNMVNISLDTPPPKMGGDTPPVIPIHNSVMSPPLITNSVALSDWAVKPSEKAKYDQLFDSLQPLNGMIPGNKVKGVLMDSKLPLHTLGKIWDLADMDKDGMLDRHEFMVAMHLVYKALEKYTIPSCLPPELLPSGNKKESVPVVKTAPVLPNVVAVERKPTAAPVVPWVVTVEERAKYDALFQQTDVDKDGFVSGLEIKDIFLQSGVPQLVLARIWSLCDTKQIGKLNGEQFALAMWLINQKVQGIDPPASLTPEMVPPSLRAKVPAEGVVENNNAPYSNPELDMITKDIEELAREKHILETDIAQKEADIKIKNGEIKSLQSELDTLAATFKQLENQKGEAQKRLNDLKNQKSAIEKELDEVKLVLEEEQDQVDNLRRQAEEQEVTLRSQEDELSCKKQELEGLKQEEARLEQKQKDSRDKLDDLTKNLRDTQLQISQAKAKITQLQEQHRQMNDAITVCDTAIDSGDASCVGDASLDIEPEFRNPEYRKLATLEQEKQVAHDDDPFGGLNGPVAPGAASGFGGEDLFKHDPFKSEKTVTSDPFSSSDDPFGSAFATKISDPLPADPFGSFGGGSTAKGDPFDPFGDGVNRNSSKSPVDMSGKDPFGCDPFASLQPPSTGGPPPRPESPSPALPPKKSKQPPPRPAPPRPLQQPAVTRAAPAPPTPSPDPQSQGHDPFADPFGDAAPVSDPFSASAANSSGSNSFANFANFDSKFSGKTLDFTEDPFRNYRYEDPFHIADPFSEERPVAAEVEVPADPFGPEDRQLAWAAVESLKTEKERRRRLEKEQADLEYALALSRADKQTTPLP